MVVTITWLLIQTTHTRAYSNPGEAKIWPPGIFARSNNWVLRLGDAPRDSVTSAGHGGPGGSRTTGRRSFTRFTAALNVSLWRRCPDNACHNTHIYAAAPGVAAMWTDRDNYTPLLRATNSQQIEVRGVWVWVKSTDWLDRRCGWRLILPPCMGLVAMLNFSLWSLAEIASICLWHSKAWKLQMRNV